MHMPSATAWVIIIIVVLLLFAAPKLPKLARSLGESMRIFKSEMKQMGDDDKKSKPTESGTEEPLEGKVVDPKRGNSAQD
ncbi:MAG: Sec-independent protein translocase subunit TatA [Galactobacter sp.]|uniref:Sec-independent protein translocase subunit TatA n=1 Tax=Galactobacter sp. TaxID=2676125 RepID=UPI0025C405C1|nr:Sec-independent protein translocase subunit TatA [Galactobacter sp.]